MNFVLSKTLPIGMLKFEWYTKLSLAILLFAPENSRYAIIGPENISVVEFSEQFTANEKLDTTTGRYLLGKLGHLDIYVDPYFTDEIQYENRCSESDIINFTDSGIVIGKILKEEK